MAFHTCGPNEAMVVSGCCLSKPSYVPGGRIFVLPGIQQIQRLPLNVMTLQVHSPKVYTQKGVPISVTGIAQVKIQGQNKEMLAAAAQQFLGKTDREIQHVAHETLEGHQRAIMGLMTVEEIFQDRHKFSEKVFEVASSDLVNMGITVVSYTLKDIHDDEGYLKALGMARTAQVKKDARMGEAEANRDARSRQALAEEKRLEAKYVNDIEIAKAKRDYELQQAIYDQEVNANKARADLAYKLQAAKTAQKIKEEEMEVQVVERTQQIALQQQEITRRERELDANIRRPADAEKFRLEKTADAEKQRIILQAQAASEAEQMKGEAEAYAVLTKGQAEAEQLIKKAAAYKEYKEAAMVDLLLEALPKMAAEISAPLSSDDVKIKMISTGDGEVGASRLAGEVMDVMQRVPNMVQNMTGVDIANTIKKA